MALLRPRVIGSTTRAAIGRQFVGDAVTALETVRALVDRLIEGGVLKREDASAIEEAASRQVLLRSMEAEAKAIDPDPDDPRSKERRK
jgi:hypothetical protein